jgi:Cys-tRNA(Pro) deacylase
MSPNTHPDTPAIRALEGSALVHTVVTTERARSVEESAGFQGIAVTNLLKTLVVRKGDSDYVFVLVPGDRSIDWPKLRAHLGVSRLSLPDAEEAREATGYERGSITPFGATTPWPVIADAVVPDLGIVAIGGGAHGVNLHVDGAELIVALEAQVADVTKSSVG